MFYSKLISIYDKSNYATIFDRSYVSMLDEFLSEKFVNNSTYLSPYEFSVIQKLSLQESIKVFSCFTGDEGIIDVCYFFECTNPSCIASRVFIDKSLFQNPDFEDEIDEHLLHCYECGREFLFEDVIPFIKIYFKFHPEITIQTLEINRKVDPNSTIQILSGLPTVLKPDSPSLSEMGENAPSEGEDPSINMETVFIATAEVELRREPLPFLESIKRGMRFVQR